MISAKNGSLIPRSKLRGMTWLLLNKSAPRGGGFGLRSASVVAKRTSAGCSATLAAVAKCEQARTWLVASQK